MNKAIIKSIFYFIFLALTLQSCKSIITTRKEVEYFNDVKIGSQDKILYFENKIQINDILSIRIDELLPEAVQPYNLPMEVTNQLSGYLVSYEGKVVIPRLGPVEVAGKTITQVEATINKLLIDKGLVKEPNSIVRIINARVTVVGVSNVNSIVSFGINNTLTILQAVGNIAPAGIKNDIVLIREEDGQRIYRKLDITKIDLVNSPYYYLKQNDVIYIKPNGPTVLQSGWLTSVGSILSVFTSSLALYLLLSR
ncbi:polysaccharide biosynthesis/export family protein [Flavobacterium myungsuense]|uniref:Polysaccharide biosynthesis/export family protein n=1 Tax=Flavobacterium myungsuense TaxID=651823 RepID=A0ABW3J0Y9_9FLAO